MLEAVWWMQERPCLLLPHATERHVWELENTIPLSHPCFLASLPRSNHKPNLFTSVSDACASSAAREEKVELTHGI